MEEKKSEEVKPDSNNKVKTSKDFKLALKAILKAEDYADFEA